MRQYQNLTTEELEKRAVAIHEELKSRSYGKFEFIISGEYNKDMFNHYEHVRNHIAKEMGYDGKLRNVKVEHK